MSNKLFNEVKNNLKSYLLSESLYKPLVTTIPTNETYPKVVIEKVNNREYGTDTGRFNVLSSMPIEINIYAQDKTVGTKKLSGRTIACEIEEHIIKFMGEYYGFKRTMDKPTPNIDKTVYRITMQYQTNINEKFNKFL